MKTLEDIRKEIDGLDDEIIRLLKKRLEFVIMTIEKKDKVEDLGREGKIISKIIGRAEDAEIEKYLTGIYQTIFEEGKKIQKHIKEKGQNEEN